MLNAKDVLAAVKLVGDDVFKTVIAGALGTLMVSDRSSPTVVGSPWLVPRAAVTLLTSTDPPAVVALTCATTVNVAVAPDAKVGIVQVGAVYVPADGVALINVMPEGKFSVSETPVPAMGPALRTCTENVTFVPFAAELTFAVFVVIRFRSSSIIVDVMLVRPTVPQADVLAKA